MKIITVVALIALLVACAYAFDEREYLKHKEQIANINAQGTTWTAGVNKFTGKSKAEIRAMLGLHAPTPAQEDANKKFFAQNKPKYAMSASSIPDSFNSVDKWPTCIHPIRNQAKCGSCWAFSASEVLSDRFCISTNGTVNSVLSPQDLVSCSSLNQGCNGGILSLTWMYLYFTGVVPDSCLPYVSGDGHVPSCPASCPSGPHQGKSLKSLKHYAKSIYPLYVDFPSKRVADMQKDIMTYGPVQSGFSVYSDFLHYNGGVYKRSANSELLGGHAIKIVGWGSENGSPYWLVANSWGEDWGEKGFFKILRGPNECGIEGDAWAGIPGNHPN